ncbi:VCBS repeat-containing protein [Nannocystis sp. RBIL2]|uniref:FG-GAP repeat domain-containing protein n=1 Tax=Nannocystis sp. RBIL2 TaxID=2996788 RepID=UPI0022713D1E|nr:VCBS repeat-containing protein [Nannocystis sp. RBIL2]MCY1067990.1 VCBS repeat-containing protein [Nannocystis sp. RBIL2]
MARHPRSTSPNLGFIAVVSVLACGGEDPCGSLGGLCVGEGRWRILATPVDDAVLLDIDGDGVEESAVLSREGRKLTLGYDSDARGGMRSALYLEGEPVGLVALPGEVAVALADPSLVAIFGVDVDGRLERRRDIALSAGPAALRGADLDGDGAPELIASLPAASAVAVVDPRSSAVRAYPAGHRPWALAIGDVDGDARRDVVVADGGPDESPGVAVERELHVLRGAGDGTLKRASASPSGRSVAWLELADHDGDGDLDAIARTPATAALVHRNDGDGGFSSPTALPFFDVFPDGGGMAVGPVAGSGLMSLAVPQGRVLSTWVGKGATWLGHVEEYVLGSTAWVGAGPDERVLVGGHSFVAAFAWQASATPVEVWRSEVVSSDFSDMVLVTGHLDGDHLLDFAVAARGALHLFHGRADLGFFLSAQFELDDRVTAMVIADVTGDGRADVVLNEGPHVRAMFGGGGDGPDVLGPSFALGVPALALVPLRAGANQPVAIAAMPIPSVGEVEVPGAAVMRFAADGAATVDVLTDALFVDALVAVDVDEDDVDEPLILGRRDGVTVLTRMTPDGAGFSPGVEHDLAALSGLTPEEGYYRQLSAADVDGDGQPEVFARFGAQAVRITGLVDDVPEVFESTVGVPTHFRDVDGDERLDALHVDVSGFDYWRGGGDGTFAEERVSYGFPRSHALALASEPDAQFDVAQLAYDAVATHIVREVMRPVEAGEPFDFHGRADQFVSADLDLDGVDDVATVSDGGGVAWMWGSEAGPLGRVDGDSLLGGANTLAVGDLDGDGFAEVITPGPYGFWVYRVQPRRELLGLWIEDESLAGVVVRLAIADVDGDGRADVFALMGVGEMLELKVAYAVAEPFHYETWTTIATLTPPEPASLELGDVDGDGDLDVLVDPVTKPGVLVRGVGARAWAEPEVLPGLVAMFSDADAAGRVELVTQDGTTIYRHTGGAPDRRTPLVTVGDASLLRAADADGDGRYDLVVGEAEATFVWLRGDDGLTRTQLAEVPLEAVDSPDIDGDRRPDVVGLFNGAMFLRTTRPTP